ncbi:MAG: efflux RND transporter periplasmic adaptor subunit [Thermoanaerobaculia bacterium]
MRATQRTIYRVPILLTLPVLLLAACGDHQTAESQVADTKIVASTASVERLEVASEIEIFGTVEAERTAAVSSRVMAMVTAVRVQTGDEVRRGQLLLEIDPQAAEGQLSQARGGLGQAQAALALAERNYERFKALAEVKAASELELDMARMQFEQAKGAVEQAEGAVSSASSVAGDSQVVAPFGGRVVQRLVEIGDLAAPGRPLMMLESTAGRRLALTVPETLMLESNLALGDEVRIRIDARADLGSLTGKITEMTPGADPASHSFRIKVALPAEGIPSGTAGRASIEGKKRELVAVPATAVLRQGGMSLVVIKTEDGRASSRVVTLGERRDGQVEILSGLSGGEVVLLGLTSVPPAGALVEVLP